MCKTRNYCSKACRNADEAAHKVCCKKGHQVEERKVKVGGKEKSEVANSNMKGLVKRRASESLPPTDREWFEVLRFDKKLLEKIQRKEDRKLKKMQAQVIDEVD